MSPQKGKKDKHFPVFALDNPLRKLFGSPRKYCVYVSQDQVVADLGCGPGFYTIALAGIVGPKGRVYAVDSDEKAVRSVERKAVRSKYNNIETHITSAGNLNFIKSDSVDFVLAEGLLCSMAPQDHASAVQEIQRILKPNGKAFIQTTRGSISYVDDKEWEFILEEFKVEDRNNEPYKGDRWALVSRRG